jgi:formylglycine-generating enzyme required for sulfatase activity
MRGNTGPRAGMILAVRPTLVLAAVLVLAPGVACSKAPRPRARHAPPPEPDRAAVLARPPAEDVRLPAVEVPPGMVHVPQGAFRMGCDEAADGPCAATETPSRTVWVSGFFLDRTEVTVGAYAACVRAGECVAPVSVGECNWGSEGRDEFPANCVTWDQAVAFCRWANRRLPTEAEWEKAARGTDGRIFPWGAEAPDAGGTWRADWGEGMASLTRLRDGWEYDAPVGFYPAGAGPYGALDQAGNLAEWVADGYREGYDPSDARDPEVAAGKEGRVVRGGSWREPARRLRTYGRDWHDPGSWYGHVGFRCAADAPR